MGWDRKCLAMMTAVGAWVVFMTGGCATSGPRYDLVLSNSSTGTVRDVTVELGRLRAGPVPLLPAKQDTCVKNMDFPLEGAAHLYWRAPDGTEVRRELALKSEQVGNFRGRLVLEIYDGGAAKLFLVPESGKPGSSLPWSMPAAWEGVISLPGLTP